MRFMRRTAGAILSDIIRLKEIIGSQKYSITTKRCEDTIEGNGGGKITINNHWNTYLCQKEQGKDQKQSLWIYPVPTESHAHR